MSFKRGIMSHTHILGISDHGLIAGDTDLFFPKELVSIVATQARLAVIDTEAQVWHKEYASTADEFVKLPLPCCQSLSIDGPYFVALDFEGFVWVSGDDGFLSFGQTLSKIEGLPCIKSIYVNASLSTVFCIDKEGGLWIYGGCWYDFTHLKPYYLSQLPPIINVIVCHDILWLLDVYREVWAYDTHCHTFNCATTTNPFIKITNLPTITSLCSNYETCVFLDFNGDIWQLNLTHEIISSLRPHYRYRSRGGRRHNHHHAKLSFNDISFIKITNIPQIKSISSVPCNAHNQNSILLLDINGVVWCESEHITYVFINNINIITKLTNSLSYNCHISRVKSARK